MLVYVADAQGTERNKKTHGTFSLIERLILTATDTGREIFYGTFSWYPTARNGDKHHTKCTDIDDKISMTFTFLSTPSKAFHKTFSFN